MVPSTIARGRNREDQGESERYHLIRKEKHISQRPVWGKKNPSAFSFARAERKLKKKKGGWEEAGGDKRHACECLEGFPQTWVHRHLDRWWFWWHGERLPSRASDVCPVHAKSKDKPRAQRKTRRTESA